MFENTLKRFWSFLLALIMVFSMIPAAALPVYATQSGSLTDTNIGVTGNGNNAAWTLDKESITGTVTGNDGGTCGSDSSNSGTLTITNKRTTAATLSFNWTLAGGGSVSGAIDSSNSTSGNYKQELLAGGSITITLTSPKGASTNTLTITNLKLVAAGVNYTTTFLAPVNGSYTVKPTGESAQSITAKTDLTRDSANTYTLSATAANGYAFVCWLDGNGNVLSNFANYDWTPTESGMAVSPMFVATNAAVWGVGTKVYTEWDAAMRAASSASDRKVTLLRNATLPAGDYTVPVGVTLLIPFDDLNTLYTTVPGSANAITRSNGNELTNANKLYRKLTLANGAKITVNGAISVGSKHISGDTSGQWWCGSPYGYYGQIDMQSGSAITVNNGGVLYAWGYVTGAGSVTINSGGSVYEMFQLQGFRGGTATTGMIGDKERVLPFSQYYVQNVEAEMTLYPGANEYVRSNIYMSESDNPSTIHFIGGDGSMFNIGSDAWVTKKYDPSTDRLTVSVNGSSPDSTVSLESMSVSFKFIINYTVKSSDYVLPINNNITINVNSGTAILTEDVALLPGSQVNVAEGATLQIADGKSVYLYDREEWMEGKYVHSNVHVKPITFSPTKTKTRTDADLVDAIMDVNGYALVEGYLYTTKSGANITSSKGTGVVDFWNGGGDATVTYQATQSGSDVSYVEIPINKAWLKNGDGSFVKTTEEITDNEFGTYFYENGKWVMSRTVTLVANDGTNTVETEKVYYSVDFNEDGCYSGKVKDYELPTDKFTRAGYHFVGWDADRDGKADYRNGQTITISDDISLTALWEINTYSVTYMADGNQVGETQKIEHGKDAKAPEIPAKTGYDQTAPKWDNDGKNITSDITINAVYTPNTYTIRYVMNEADENELYTIPAKHDEKLPEYQGEPLSWLGYTFDGWACDGKIVNSETVVQGKMTVYSRWKQNQYTIHFSDGVADLTFTVDESSSYELSTPTKTGYDFKGWKDANGNVYTSETRREAMITAIEKNGMQGDQTNQYSISLNAVWEEKMHTVTFDANGGLGSMEAQTIGEVTKKALTENAFTRAGYTFLGWSENQSATTATYQNQAEITVSNDTTLYAIWQAGSVNYTVETYTMGLDGSYDSHGTETETATVDTEVTLNPTAPEGFTLDTDNSILSGTATADNSLVLKVYYSRNQYNVTWTVDGVSYDSDTYYYGAEITAPEYTAPAGYTFSGWTADETMPAKDMTYEATLTTNIVNLYLHPNGGSWTNGWEEGDFRSSAFTYGNDSDTRTWLNLQQKYVAREGYTFMGWTTVKDDASTLVINDEYKLLPVDVQLYALWQVNQHTITWIVDGNKTTEQVAYGTTITLPTEPTKTGHIFAGWTGYIEGMTMPDKDVEFTASWTAISYTIWLDTDGDGSVDKEIEAPYGSTLSLENGSKAADEVNEYKFLGWSTEKDGEVLNELPKVSGDATYYAVFQANPITYTITMDEQGGSDVADLTGGHRATVILPEPTKTGYSFLGWAETTDSNAEVMKADTEYTITQNDTLYAVWQVNQYTITFELNGGKIGDQETYSFSGDYNTQVTAPADPTLEGYDFVRWNPEIPGTMPAENMTITAQWKIKTFTIGWDIDGDGVAEYKDTVEWNTIPVYDAEEHGKITKESTVATDYTWSGWTVEPVKAVADTVYTAKFTTSVREYTITWDVEGEKTTTSAAYGTMPAWTGDAPTKAEDNYNTYSFTGWSPELIEVTGDATYTAQFESTAKVYTLNIDLDGGHIGEETAIVISGGYGTEVETVDEPSKTGYTFSGWSEEIPTKLTENKTITAKWTINQYTITIDPGNGDEKHIITQDYGTEIETVDDPVREGYNFTGWTPEIPKTMPAEDVEIAAGWSINQYTITFDTAGGSEINPIIQNYGTAVTAPENPTKAGYTFLKWVDENGEEATVPAVIPAKNVKLKAVWEANINTITLYTEKDGDPYATITAKTDEPITERWPDDPTKEGHTFGGWVDSTGSPVAQRETMPTADMVLYAKWNISEFTITFDLDGGEIDDELVWVITENFDTPINAPEEPEKEGYTFAGWVTKDADGNETKYMVPEAMPAENVKVFAKWNINQYTIRFQDDSGVTLSSATVDYGNTITVPTVTKEGYTFVKWIEEIPGTMPAHDVTITSEWTINQYTITFVTDGGTVIDPITADYGTALTAPDAPTKEGYTFDGWDEEFPAAMPSHNLTLTAKWNLNTYTVTWNNYDGSQLAVGTVNHGDTPVYSGSEPVKGETAEYYYTFTGWDPAVAAANGNVTYTAQFEEHRKSYTVTFVYDNGEANNEMTVVYGDAIAEPETPVKEGYTFQGWNPALPETMPANNITATAQWKKVEYTISLDDGEKVTTITAGWGETYSRPADPTKEGHTFGGWVNAEGSVVTLPESMPVGGLELKAVWNVNQYTITFDTDGGNEIAPITQNYGTAVTAPAAPAKDDYTFQGWDPALPATMPAENVTVVAQWKYTYTGWITDDIGTTYLVSGEKAYFDEWVDIEGSTYYFDDQSYVVYDLYTTTAQDGSHVGTFVFGEDGKFLKDKNGVHISASGDTWWVENGEVILDKGLTRVVLDDGEVNYYYFGEDGKALKSTSQWLVKHNDLLVEWEYAFDENGVIIHHEDTSRQGVHADENGVDCYYIDGVKIYRGLFMIGEDYYYARHDGSLVKDKTYWISKTNGLLPETSYTFDEYGRIYMEKADPKNGFYYENGAWYYYVDSSLNYAGLIYGAGPNNGAEGYYYVNSTGRLITDCTYWISKTNDLLPEQRYTFDENGRIIFKTADKNGFVEENNGIYYYVDGKLTYAGLIYVDGYYYYVNSSCRLVTSRTYWISKTNGLLPETSYTFDADGKIVFESKDETLNGIVDGYYYVDGVKTYAGLIEIDGAYYYVNSSCKVVTSRTYWISKTNGLLAEKAYTFDETGKMVMG